MPFSRRLALPLAVLVLAAGVAPPSLLHPTAVPSAVEPRLATDPSVGNFTAAIGRMVTLLGLSGSGLLAIVWARVALSWFSHDVTKKIQAKERARDALIGTILFTAAVSGLLYGLAHWVVTGA